MAEIGTAPGSDDQDPWRRFLALLARIGDRLASHPLLSLSVAGGLVGGVVLLPPASDTILRLVYDGIGFNVGTPPETHGPPQPNGHPPGPPTPSAPALPGGDPAGTELDRLLAQLDHGGLVFNTPPRMRVSSTREIQAVLQPNVDFERLRGLITAAGQVEGHQIRVANIMQAELRGVAFQISPDGPQEQPVSRSEPTQWTWQVKAKESGPQVLTLTLAAKVRIENQERPRLIKTFTRKIEVDVAGSWVEQIADALAPWQKIVGALAAIGGAGWGFYVWWRKHVRRRRPARP